MDAEELKEYEKELKVFWKKMSAHDHLCDEYIQMRKVIRQLADYAECVPDDRYNAEHIARDELVAEAKRLLGVSVL